MDAFVRLFPSLGRRILTGIACTLALVYCGLILYGSWIYLAKMKKIGIHLEDIEVQAWIAHSIPVITTRIAIVLVNVIRGKTEGFKHVDEAKESMEIVSDLKEEETK